MITLLQIYLVLSILFSIAFLVILRYDKGFDKWVHDETGGMVEFTWSDKIVVPIIAGFTWPYFVYRIIGVMINGR